MDEDGNLIIPLPGPTLFGFLTFNDPPWIQSNQLRSLTADEMLTPSSMSYLQGFRGTINQKDPVLSSNRLRLERLKDGSTEGFTLGEKVWIRRRA